METPWTKSPEEILEHFAVDPNRGLSADQASKHAEIYGKNGVFEAPSSFRYLIV
jgi:Ca2+ transporting ATPase